MFMSHCFANDIHYVTFERCEGKQKFLGNGSSRTSEPLAIRFTTLQLTRPTSISVRYFFLPRGERVFRFLKLFA